MRCESRGFANHAVDPTARFGNHATMILEGVVTTLNATGDLNVAPMGPIVDPSMQTLLLRPFQTSTTFQNMQQTQSGVLHVVDDVLLIAKAITRQLETPETLAAEKIEGRVLASACRWYEFKIDSIDDSQQRTECHATVVHTGRLRDSFGFNRAKHAVIEAAILATRTHLLDEADVIADLERLTSPVEKTAGPAELQAFELISEYVRQQYEAKQCAKS